MSKNSISVETRAWVDGVQDIEIRLAEMGAKYLETLYIEDEFYADLSVLNVDQHTFEQEKRAARIRAVTDRHNNCKLIAHIREVPKESLSEFNLHDVTVTTFEEEADVKNKPAFIKEFKVRGFTDLVTTISKERKVYELNGSSIFLDDINSFSKSLEIKTYISDISKAKDIKSWQKEVLIKLGIPKDDFIEKSPTHLIIDSYFKSQPKLKLKVLQKKLKELTQEKEKLMLQSEDCFREGGDGWHDNARWDILRENIDVISIRITKLKDEILNLSKS